MPIQSDPLLNTINGIITEKNNIQNAILTKGGTLGGDGLNYCVAGIESIPVGQTTNLQWIPADWISLEQGGEYVNYLFLVPDGETLTITYDPTNFPNCTINFYDGPNSTVNTDALSGVQTRTIGLEALAGMSKTSDNLTQVLVGVTCQGEGNITSFGDLNFNRGVVMVKSNTPSATSMNLAGIPIIDIGDNNIADATGIILSYADQSGTVVDELTTILNLKLNFAAVDNLLFSSCTKLKSIKRLEFPLAESITGVSSSVERIDELVVPALTSFESAFSYSNIKYIGTITSPLCTNFNNMFGGATKLTEVGSIDTSSGTLFSNMFNMSGPRGESSLTKLPNTLQTWLGTDFSGMFWLCNLLKTIPQLDLTNATTTANMFNGCKNLEAVDLITFTSSNTDASSMFGDCLHLKQIPALDWNSVVEKSWALTTCFNIETINDISLFKNGDAVEIGSFSKLKYINAGDCTGVINFSAGGCYRLKSIDITSFSGDYINFNLAALPPVEIIKIFNALGENPLGQIHIIGCAGTPLLTQEDIEIATLKGWTVNTEYPI